MVNSLADINTGKEKIAFDRQKDFFLMAQPYASATWAEQDRDIRICYGDSTVWREIYRNVGANGEDVINLNRSLVIKNMLTGHQRRNRKASICVPQEESDNKTSDQFSKLLMWNFQADNIYNKISDAFEMGTLITGMSLLHVGIDYTDDLESGDLTVKHLPWNSFIVDPFFRERDFSDCAGVLRQAYFTKENLALHFPDFKAEIMGMQSGLMSEQTFTYLPEQFTPQPKALLRLSEFYYSDTRTQYVVYDPLSGKWKEWRNPDKNRVREYLSRFPTAMFHKREIPTVRLTVTIENLVVSDGPQPLGVDRMPFVPVMGYYNPELQNQSMRVMGVVRNLRDSQYLYNSRKSIELTNLKSVLNAGYIYKPSSLIDPNDINNTYPGKGIGLEKNAQVTDVIPIQQQMIPPTTLEVSAQMSNEPQIITGISDEILGSSNDDVGITTMLKQGAALVTQNVLFDNLDLAQSVLSKLMIESYQANFTPAKVKRIINEEPTQAFYDQDFPKFDVAIEDAVYTSTQRQVEFLSLAHLRKLGVAIPDERLIQSITVQNKDELIETIKAQSQQQAQMQQMQMQMAMQETQAQNELVQSKTQENISSSMERQAQVMENQATATEKKTMALLDLIKAMNELEGLELQDIEKAVNMISTLKQLEQQAVTQTPVSPTQVSQTQAK